MSARKIQHASRGSGESLSVSVLVLAVGSFAVIGASAVAPLISRGLGLTPIGIGAIASFAYLGALLTAPLAGRATDRSGPSRVIVLGLAALAAGSVLAGLAWQSVILYAGMLIVGCGYGAINPATTVLANPLTARRRALVMSIKQAGVPAGGIAAGAILPVVGFAFGWRWAFALTGGLSVLVALGVLVRGGYRSRASASDEVQPFKGRQLRLPVGYAFGLIIAGVQVSLFAFTAVYLVDARDFSVSAAGLGVSTLLLGGVIGRLSWGWLADLFPEHRVLVLCVIALLGSGLLMMMVVAPVSLLPVVLLVLGACSSGWNGVYIAVVAESVDSLGVGKATGMSLALINAGAITFPLALGALVAATSRWMNGFIVLSLLSICAALIVWLSSKKVVVK